ncbi:MAG: transglycosylase domain-containing protein [Actinobacteria bacterium]|nr:transglycosylase domain-containing protein [Actinomycetota bacterium]
MPSSSRSRSRRPGRRPPPKKRPAAKAAKPPVRKARPTAPKKKVTTPPRSWTWRHRKGLFLMVLGGFTVIAGATYVYFRLPLPKDVPPAQTTFLYDVHGKRLASLDTGQTRVAVPLTKVPKVLIDAVLSSEDRNFYKHGGIDPVGIVRATWADLRNRGTVQGGSTITQQYVKNTYLGQERTFTRKLKEAALAVKIQRKLSKDEILERYLNTVYFGRHAYGVQAAARAYYGKDVGELGLNESAYLAGLIRAPELAQPERNMQLALTRRHLVLEAMQRNRKITEARRSAVEATPLGVQALRKVDPAVEHESDGTDYFVDYVRRQLISMFGEAAVYSGGFRVKTSLDPGAQRQAYQAVYGTLDRDSDPKGAVVALDDHGLVRAMVGGKDYKTSKVNLAVGKDGGGSGRQAGSTFKPFLLAETVKEGYSVESALPGPAKVVLPKADVGPYGPRDWTVTNFDNEDYGPKVSLIDATRNSVNTVYAQLVVAIGADKLKQMAADLGVKTPLQAVNAMVLGSQEVSAMDMATAFSTFANLGERVDPRTIVEVDGPDGHVLKKFDEKRTRVLDRQSAAIVDFCLQQVVQRGTGVGANIGKPMIGKTGTTENFGDAWFVGGTRKLTAAVWMGYPEGASHAMDNVRGIHVNGGSFPATIFKKFMSAAQKGVDPGSFPSVSSFPGKLLKGTKVIFSTSTTTPSGPATTVVGGTSTTVTNKSSSSTTVPGPAPTSTLPPPPPTTSPPRGGGGGGGQETTTTVPRRRNNNSP